MMPWRRRPEVPATPAAVSAFLEEDRPFELGAFEDSTTRTVLPLSRIDLRARVAGLHASVVVEQELVNARGTPLEVQYVFPLPALGAVSGYRFTLDGVRVLGTLMERGAARESYDRALAAGHAASTLEMERPEVMTVRVGNLPPGSTVRVHLELDLILPLADDTALLRLPLVVGARYVPGTPLDAPRAGGGTSPDTDDAPDASRVTPPLAARNDVVASIEVEAIGVQEVVSTRHALDVERHPDGLLVRVRDAQANGDVVLRFPLPARAEAIWVPDVDPGTDAPSASDRWGDGTIVATVCAPARNGAATPPLDLVLLIDRSGSMAGGKIVATRRCADGVVRCLQPRDRLCVVAFDDRLDLPLGPELVRATAAQRRRACSFLGALEARGGTEIDQALRVAAGALQRSEDGDTAARRRVVVLVTDGQVANEEQVVRTARRQLAGAEVLSVAIGAAANAGLCVRLSGAGGACETVESDAALGPALDRTQRRLLAIAAAELELDVEGAVPVADSRAPLEPQCLVAGVPTVLALRVRGRPTSVRLHARTGRALEDEYREDLPVRALHAPGLARTWARLHVRDLEDALTVADWRTGPALTDSLLDTSLRFGVLCRDTAFVAVDESRRVVRPGTVLDHVMQPVLADGPDPRGARNTATRAGVLRGKLRYLSPERARGLPTTPADDVFVLAIVLAELALGELLFSCESELEILTNIAAADVVLAARLAERMPRDERVPALAALLERALARDPARRPQDGAALRDALATVLGDDVAAPAELGALVRRLGLDAPAAPVRRVLARRASLWAGTRRTVSADFVTYELVVAAPPDAELGALAGGDAVVHVPLAWSEVGAPLALYDPHVARVVGVRQAPPAWVVEDVRGPNLAAVRQATTATSARSADRSGGAADRLALDARTWGAIALGAARALAAVHAAGVRLPNLTPWSFVLASAGPRAGRTVLTGLPTAPRGARLPPPILPLHGLPARELDQ